MSVQSANEFARASATDPGLLAEVSSAVNGKNPSDAARAVSELAKTKNFDFSPEEGTEAREAFMRTQSLSDDDLNRVAGGAGDPMINTLITTGATVVVGQALPAGAGGVVGAGVGAGISTAIQGGTPGESLVAGSMASAEAADDLGKQIRNFFSGW